MICAAVEQTFLFCSYTAARKYIFRFAFKSKQKWYPLCRYVSRMFPQSLLQGVGHVQKAVSVAFLLVSQRRARLWTLIPNEAIAPWPCYRRLWRLALWKTRTEVQAGPCYFWITSSLTSLRFLIAVWVCVWLHFVRYRGHGFKELNQNEGEHELRFHRKRKK